MIGKRKYGRASLRLSVPKGLPLSMSDDVVELSSLYTATEHRGCGNATRLLANVTAEADWSKRFLLVHVDPEDGDKPRLANFYARHGFMPIQAEPLLMVRPYSGLING